MGHHHTEANQAFFDEQAATYDTRNEKTLTQMVEEIRARRNFIGVAWSSADDGEDDPNDKAQSPRAVKLLDYACGTGSITRALAPYTTQCIGIDLSEKMVGMYNARAEDQGLTKDEVFAYQGDLAVPDDPKPPAFAAAQFFDFDIAAVGLGFHHFGNPDLAAQRLVERLRPGGVLMILDFLPHEPEGPGHAAHATVVHHGFSESRIKDIFEGAGAGKDFGVQVIRDVVFPGSSMRRRLFMARGTKA